jgi:monothiol glutaredoxin
MADRITTDSPATIAQLSAPEVKTLIEGSEPFELVDVRTEGEHAVASIDGFRLLDQPYYQELLLRDPDTPLVFLCHHGIRSQGAAEHFRGEGFRRLYNLRGGIDAWSVLVDASVPRY